MTRLFELYTLFIAALFALAAGLTLAWGWHWLAPVGLGFMALSALYGSWGYAHAPEMEEN
jgi:hypothetical protein